jgi:hypothetical protein
MHSKAYLTLNREARGERREFLSSACSAFSAVVVCVLACGAPAAAQSVAGFSLESVIAVDEFGGEGTVNNPQVIIDVSAAVRMGDRWQVYLRPWFRQPRPQTAALPVPPWNTEIYQAGIRYERPGAIATRIDAGYILSPIGLGPYDARPDINPTILPHLSYLQPMPTFDPTGPRVSAVSSSYPLGAQVTLSTGKWDARGAVINTAPTRSFVVGNPGTNPRQTPVLVAGAGITPTIGLRLGASVAQGVYATSDEITRPASQGRSMTMAGGEGEWAFGGTKISAEILRTAFDAAVDTAVAYEWFVQGQQTLTPRWFAAGRYEGTSAPPLNNGIVVGTRTDLQILEATAGYRISPDITLRASFVTRKSYGASLWANQFGASIVWAQRWW